VLWTKPHFKRGEGESAEAPGMLVASRSQTVQTNKNEKPVPANILTISIPFQYQTITNLVDWALTITRTPTQSAKTGQPRSHSLPLTGTWTASCPTTASMAAGRIRRRVQARANGCRNLA